MAQKKVKDGVYYHHKFGRVMEHQGFATRIFWSPTMLDYLRRNFATTLNEELAEWLGVSQRTMLRKARELGLEKDAKWLLEIWEDRRLLAQSALKRKGYPGTFQKGEHRNPAHEFKAGHRLTDEQQRKRAEKLRKWSVTHPDVTHARMVKAWETRRRKEAAC